MSDIGYKKYGVKFFEDFTFVQLQGVFSLVLLLGHFAFYPRVNYNALYRFCRFLRFSIIRSREKDPFFVEMIFKRLGAPSQSQKAYFPSKRKLKNTKI